MDAEIQSRIEIELAHAEPWDVPAKTESEAQRSTPEPQRHYHEPAHMEHRPRVGCGRRVSWRNLK